MNSKQQREMQVVVLWEQFIHQMLDVTSRFPKQIRPVVVHRLMNYCFDVLDGLITAQYAERALQQQELHTVNLLMTKIRFLLRISCQERWVSEGQVLVLNDKMDEVGRGIHGWEKSLSSV